MFIDHLNQLEGINTEKRKPIFMKKADAEKDLKKIQEQFRESTKGIK